MEKREVPGCGNVVLADAGVEGVRVEFARQNMHVMAACSQEISAFQQQALHAAASMASWK